jgi:hypothetical protein
LPFLLPFGVPVFAFFAISIRLRRIQHTFFAYRRPVMVSASPTVRIARTEIDAFGVAAWAINHRFRDAVIGTVSDRIGEKAHGENLRTGVRIGRSEEESRPHAGQGRRILSQEARRDGGGEPDL